MPGRVVLFGATGFTGRLTAAALVGRGLDPLLVGRSGSALEALAADVGAEHTAVADASDQRSLTRLLRSGDVLVTTVGPFLQHGRSAATAALEAGATYLDSTGEPAFLRWLAETLGGRAERAGVVMLPAFGYDYVPGNLAGGLAVHAAGPRATRVDVGYFVTGSGGDLGWVSGGTRASSAGAMTLPSHAWRDGRLRLERTAASVRRFDVHGRAREAVSVGGSEPLSLPRWAPQLRDVTVYLGWGGRLARPLQALSLAASVPMRLGPVRAGVGAAARRLFPGSTGGPDAAQRARARTLVVAEAFDAGGSRLARVVVDGPSPYDLTAELLAWGAETALVGTLGPPGVVGPVEGFGLDELVAGCASVGLRAVEPGD